MRKGGTEMPNSCNRVRVVLSGCDGSTSFVMDVDERELEFLEKLHNLSYQDSSSQCDPVLDWKCIPQGSSSEGD